MDAREFYNQAAANYDAGMTSASISASRLRFQELVSKHAPGAGIVLDFGCGTGVDASAFVERGRRVLAYDPSEAMLDRLRERCAPAIKEGRILPVGGELANLHAALSKFAPLQAVVANFGVLNLLPDLTAFVDLVTSRLPTVQSVILGVQNPFYLPDMRAGWWWRGLWRGWKAGTIVCDATAVPTRRYFIGTLASALAPRFRLCDALDFWTPMRLLAFVRAA
jgi:SAM-dependent methyltransferase